MAQKHLGVLIAYGAEIRSFIYSGLMEELLSSYKITLFSHCPNLKYYYQHIPSEVEIIPLPMPLEPYILRKWRRFSGLLHALWVEKQGTKRWRYTIKEKTNHGFYKELRSSLIHSLAGARMAQAAFIMEKTLGRVLGTSATWKTLFQDFQIDAIVSMSFFSERALPALQTATNLGLKTIVFMHSWKEPYKNPHLSLIPTRTLVWSPLHVEKLVHFNPWIESRRINTVGSLHLEPFISLSKLMPEDIFYSKAGLDPTRPFICYTAADPRTALHEENIIQWVLEAIANKQFSHNFQLLLRLNPMEDGSRFQTFASLYPSDLVIQRPQWDWLPESGWICPLEEDTSLWVSTAYYSQLNISLPSTVTLEFGALGRPVINICFDLPEAPTYESSNLRYWEADWYSEIKLLNIALPAFTSEELIKRVEESSKNRSEPGTIKNNNNWLQTDAVSESILIMNAEL